MTIDQLIQKLKAQGVTTTEDQISDLLGSTEYLTDDDIPSIVGMLTATPSDPNAAGKSKRRKGGSLAKSKESTTQAGLALPTAAQIQKMDITQVSGWITSVEALHTEDSRQAEQIITVLGLLYERRRQAIDFNRSAVQAFRQQDQELADSTNELGQALNESLETMQQVSAWQKQMSGEASERLAESFRRAQAEPTLLERFNSLIRTPGTGI